MTTQLIAPSHPAQPPARPPPAHPHRRRHRRRRRALATGSYLATTTIGPDTTPPTPATGTDVNLSAQTQRELNQSIAGQYGSRSAADAVVNPSAQTMRELHQSIVGQYGSRSGAPS